MSQHPLDALPKIVLLSGNTHRPSKSQGLAAYLGAALAERMPVHLGAFDLIDAGRGLGAAYFRSQLSPQARAVIAEIEAADALIVATPVYKGSYPGLFKHLVDLLEPDALVDKPVLVAASGGGHRHALVVEHQLRPLFGFFSAHVAPTSVYAADSEFTDGVPTDPLLVARAAQATAQFAAMIAARQDRARAQGARAEGASAFGGLRLAAAKA